MTIVESKQCKTCPVPMLVSNIKQTKCAACFVKVPGDIYRAWSFPLVVVQVRDAKLSWASFPSVSLRAFYWFQYLFESEM